MTLLSKYTLILPFVQSYPPVGEEAKLRADNPSGVTSQPKCLVPERTFLQDWRRSHSRPSKLGQFAQNYFLPQLRAIQLGSEVRQCFHTSRLCVTCSTTALAVLVAGLSSQDSSGHDALPRLTSLFRAWCRGVHPHLLKFPCSRRVQSRGRALPLEQQCYPRITPASTLGLKCFSPPAAPVCRCL